MSWIHQGKEINELPTDCVGFVYIIENLITGKKYVGKKLSCFSKTKYKTIKLKNGKKKRKKIKTKIPSDWQTYYGSSKELLKDIEILGKENFTREILHYCRSKAQTSYFELKEQVDRKVLESNDYYNNIIQVRIHGSHIIKK
jgi:hypothetical protein